MTYFDGKVEETLADIQAALISKTTTWKCEREWRPYVKEDQIDRTVGDPADPIPLLDFPPDASVLTPSQHSMRSHFGSVVRDDHARLAAPADPVIQFTGHAGTRQGTINDGCQRLARKIIHDSQHPGTLAVCKRVRHAVQ